MPASEKARQGEAEALRRTGDENDFVVHDDIIGFGAAGRIGREGKPDLYERTGLYNNRRSAAIATACARFSAPSLLRIAVTWNLAVRSLMRNFAAICLFD